MRGLIAGQIALVCLCVTEGKINALKRKRNHDFACSMC